MKGKLQKIHPLGITIIIGTLFARFATSMSIPFLAIYLTTVKGVSAGMTGAIIGMSALVGVFASFIGGNLSDRFGRNTIIIWSMIAWVFVFIDSIAVSHLKGTYFGAMGFSGIGTVIGPWFGGVLLDYYGYQNGFSVFSALAIFSTVAFPVLLVTKGLLKKRYDRNSNMEVHAK